MKNIKKTEAVRWSTYWFVLGLALHYLFTAYNHTLSAFINYTPQFSCQDPEFEGKQGCVYNTSRVSVRDSCTKGYTFFSSRNETTIVTEWSLICDDRLYQPMVTTLYFVGVTLGALVTGILADKVGRKPPVLFCLYAHSVLGVVISLCTYNFVLYIVLRAVQGFFVQGLQSCTYTLVLEIIPTQYRTAMGVIAEFYWSAGLMLLSLASFYIPHWRTLQFILSVSPVVLSLVYVWFVPESNIWLQLNKSNEKKTLKNITERQTQDQLSRQQKLKIQKENENSKTTEADPPSREGSPNFEMKTVGDSGSEDQAMFDTNKLPIQQEVTEEDMVKTGREKYVLEVLWFSRGLRKYNIVMVVTWFSTMIAYYTITFHIPNLSGDRHLNFFLGALVELAAYAIAYVVLSRLGRRLPLSFYQLLGGVICCTVAFIPPNTWAGGVVTTVITLLGKGSVVSSFCCLNLYTSELFPTTVRAAALGHCAFWGRIGSLLAPQLVVLGDYTSRSVPLIAVGIIGILTCFVVLALPETLGRPLPNNLQDVESMNRAQERKTKQAIRNIS